MIDPLCRLTHTGSVSKSADLCYPPYIVSVMERIS